MSSTLVEGLVYEASLVADGMEKGKAQALSVLTQVERQAEKTGAAIDRIGTAGPLTGRNDARRQRSITELSSAFRAGGINHAEYEKRVASLGIKLQTLDASAKAAASGTVAAGNAAKVAGLQAAGSTSGFAGLGRTLSALGIAASVRELVQAADTYTMLTGRLRLVTSSSEELAAVQSKLFDLAQSSRASLESTTDLYTRLARSTKELGLSQEELLKITRVVNQGFVISGASAASSAAALVQLGQAFSSGTLRGEELNSVLEQAPRLAQAIAEGMGVSVGKLRELGAAGELTSKQIADALLSQAAAVNKEFAQMPLTVAQSLEAVKNATLKYIGQADQSRGASSALAQTLEGVAHNFNVLANSILAVGTVAGARALAPLTAAVSAFAVRQAQTIKGAGLAVAAETKYTASVLANATAQRVAAASAVARAASDQQGALVALRVATANTTGTASMQRQAMAANVLRASTLQLMAAKAQLATAEVVATRAALAHTAAVTASTVAARGAAAAMGLLRGAMMFLGGPIGLAIVALGAAWATVAHNTRVAADEAENFKRAQGGIDPKAARGGAAIIQQRIDANVSRVVAGGGSAATEQSIRADVAKRNSLLAVADAAERAQKALEGDPLAKLKSARSSAAAFLEELDPNEQAKLKKKIAKLSAELKEAGATVAEVARFEKEALSFKGRKGADALRERQATARQAFESAIAAKTPDKQDNFEEEVDKLVKQAQRAKLGADEIRQLVASFRAANAAGIKKVQEELGRELRDLTAASTISAVDDLENTLADLIRTMRAKGASVEMIDAIEQLQQPMIDATEQAEKLSRALEFIERDVSQGFNLSGNLAKIGGLIDDATKERDAAKPGSTQQAAAQKTLNDLITKELEIRKRIKELQDASRAATKSVASQTAQLAGDISDAANAAYLLAAAFLGVDSNITKALASLGQLASGIEKTIASAESGDILGTVAGVAQTIQGIVGLGQSIFGEDPKIKAARQETLEGMNRLKVALLELRDAYLQNVSTEAAEKDKDTANKIIAGIGTGPFGSGVTFDGERVLDTGEGTGAGRRGNFRKIAAAAGYNFDDGTFQKYIKELDERYNLGLSEFVKNEDPAGFLAAVKLLPAAIQEALGNMGRFGDDAAGVIERINFELGVLGKTDPAAKFRATIKALKEAGISFGEFADELGELADPNTTAERAAEITESVLARLREQGVDFGGLTPEQLRALLTQGADASRSETGGTGGFNTSTTITEVTGSRMAGLLITSNVFAEATAKNTALIAQLMGGVGTVGPVGAPPIPAGANGIPAAIGGTTVIIEAGAIAVTCGSGVTEAQAISAGEALSDALIREIDRKLGQRANFQARAAGSVLLN